MESMLIFDRELHVKINTGWIDMEFYVKYKYLHFHVLTWKEMLMELTRNPMSKYMLVMLVLLVSASSAGFCW